MTSAIEVHAAALRAAQVTDADLGKLALWLMLDDSEHGDFGLCQPEVAERLGFDHRKMHPGERYEVSAAALSILAERYEASAAALSILAEFARLTPFQRWFQRNHTETERKQFNERDLRMMEIGFTKHGRENS